MSVERKVATSSMGLDPTTQRTAADKNSPGRPTNLGDHQFTPPSVEDSATFLPRPRDTPGEYKWNRDLKHFFETFIDHRKNFWNKLLSVPYVQESWVDILKETLSGGLSATGPLFLKCEASPTSVSHILHMIEPHLSRLNETNCQKTKALIRSDIASILVAMPMQPEAALILANEVVRKCHALLHGGSKGGRIVEEVRRGKLFARIHPRGFRSPEESLGTDVSSARTLASELLSSREKYLNARNEIYQRTAYLANRYGAWRMREGGDTGDIIQNARVGLLKAIERFPLDTGIPFSHSAGLWMNHEVCRFVSSKSSILKVGRAERKVINMDQQGHSDQENSRFLRIEEIAEGLGIRPEVARALGYLRNPILPIESSHGVLARSVADTDPLLSIERAESMETLRGVMMRLPERERAAISLRFGLEDQKEKTFLEIGRHLECSEATAFRLVNGALGMLRRRLNK